VGGDCDDTHAEVNPAAEEVCDGLDDDCNGYVGDQAIDAGTWYADFDGDSFGDADGAVVDCEQPAGCLADATDCDDADATVNSGGTETCDGADDDCDGQTDEADATDALTWYIDADGDGSGTSTVLTAACTRPAGFAATSDDCDDAE